MSKIENYLQSLFSLSGKVILLTGAAGGIGQAFAEGLAAAGGCIAMCDIDIQSCGKIAQELESKGMSARPYELDVSNSNSIKKCVNAVLTDYEKIDVLINCAGINKREGILDVEEETYDRIMDINLKGAFLLSQEVVKHMITRKQGNIINIGSYNDEGMMGGCSVYGAAKSGLRALTRSMAVEWAKHGIRANALSPGHIITPLTTVTWEHPTRSKYLEERIAMRRPGTPEELVGICIMLASDASSYMTGQAYHVDGGYSCGGNPWEFDTNY
jgi:NAD(P)-dependent dehydrogenase (short-subunit alcohol dehydrogenase family)